MAKLNHPCKTADFRAPIHELIFTHLRFFVESKLLAFLEILSLFRRIQVFKVPKFLTPSQNKTLNPVKFVELYVTIIKYHLFKWWYIFTLANSLCSLIFNRQFKKQLMVYFPRTDFKMVICFILLDFLTKFSHRYRYPRHSNKIVNESHNTWNQMPWIVRCYVPFMHGNLAQRRIQPEWHQRVRRTLGDER